MFEELIITTLTGAKPAEAVISLGEDLTPVQKDRVMEYFKDWTKGKTLHYISVSNEEERKYLEGSGRKPHRQPGHIIGLL